MVLEPSTVLPSRGGTVMPAFSMCSLFRYRITCRSDITFQASAVFTALESASNKNSGA